MKLIFVIAVLICIIIIYIFTLSYLAHLTFQQAPQGKYDTDAYIDVVIARYKENVGWVRNLLLMPYIKNIYLYNKGPFNIPYDILKHPKVIYKELVNKGRESDTYLQHIMTYFDDLADMTVFAQGDPFDQAPQFLSFFPLHQYWDRVYQPMSYTWFESKDVPPRSLVNMKGTWFHGLRIYEQEYYLDTLQAVDFKDNGLMNILKNYQKCRTNKTQGIIQEAVQRYMIPIKTKTDKTGVFNFGAIFAVSRESIRKHGYNVYQRMLRYSDECDTAGYVFERLWMMFFRADPLHLRFENMT